MSEFSKEWTTEKLEKLRAISVNYSIQEKAKIELQYLNNLLVRLPELEVDKNDILIKELDAIIECLPLEFDELIYGSYLSKFNDIVYLVKKRFNLIPQKYHRKEINTFSFASIIGLIFTGLVVYFSLLLFKKPIFVLAIGIPLGVIVSKLVGIYLDRKAGKENRVI